MNYVEVVLSLLYRMVGCLFGPLAVLVRSDLPKDVESLVLCHKNQVLRQLSGRQRWIMPTVVNEYHQAA